MGKKSKITKTFETSEIIYTGYVINYKC